MKTIVAGSRTFTDDKVVVDAMIACGWDITEIVSGGAKGVDAIGEEIARATCTPLTIYFANWKKHKKAAGILRNVEMAKNAQALVAVWDGVSPGTKHMIEVATKHGLRVYVHLTNKE